MAAYMHAFCIFYLLVSLGLAILPEISGNFELQFDLPELTQAVGSKKLLVA